MATRMSRARGRRSIPKPAIYIAAGVLVVVIIALVAIFVLPGKQADETAYEAFNNRQIQNAMENVKAPVSDQRQTVIDSGLTLLGKVNYFWGGKSLQVGWDESWGKPRVVESKGSEMTGKEIPNGLDCSGFVAWCVKQTGMSDEDVKNKLGLGTYWQWENSEEITWEEIMPGDLAFQNTPDNSENHVGICIGFSKNDNPVFLHCASSFNNVVVTGRGDVFNYPRRPKLYED